MKQVIGYQVVNVDGRIWNDRSSLMVLGLHTANKDYDAALSSGENGWLMKAVREGELICPVLEDVSPLTTKLLDTIIQDWHMAEFDHWKGPEEHKNSYRFVISKSNRTNRVYFQIYESKLDEASQDLPLHGLSGVIEVRNGKPALSIGVDEHVLGVHVESDIERGLWIHSDDGMEPESALFESFDHGTSFPSLFYPCGYKGWLKDAEEALSPNVSRTGGGLSC